MENKEELKVIVDRVGLRRYDERSYVTINTEDEEKLIKLMKENNIPNTVDRDALKPFAESESEFSVEYNMGLNGEKPTPEQQKEIFEKRDQVVDEIYDILADGEVGGVDYGFLREKTEELLNEEETDGDTDTEKTDYIAQWEETQKLFDECMKTDKKEEE